MPELAYIDPGTGSLIIQTAIAAAIAVPLFFRHQIGRFLNSDRLSFVRRRSTPDKPSASVDDGTRGR